MLVETKLEYFENPYKLSASVDNEIGNYYRSLIPSYFRINKPRYNSHISIIRNEIPINLNNWKIYQGETFLVKVNNVIHYDELYFWLNVTSKDFENIRLGLGLPRFSECSKPPDDSEFFHITIANMK